MDSPKNLTTDDVSLEVVAAQLSELLDVVQNNLQAIFGSQLREILLDIECERGLGISERSARKEDMELGNVLDNCMTAMDTFGLRLRKIALDHATMTPLGGGTPITPESVVIDCVEPLKLIEFLQNLQSSDLSFLTLRAPLEKLGEQFFSQVCYRYNLTSPTDDEIALIGNISAIAKQFQRLHLEPIVGKLLACAEANDGGYLCEYSLLAKEGIFENDIAMRYIDRNEWCWYEMDWNSAILALNRAFMNPKAEAFVRATRDDLLEKAKRAKELFQKWEVRTEGWYFAHRGIKTLDTVIPSLEKIGI